MPKAPRRKSQPPPSPERPVYPFAAIVGQEEMRLALVLNSIDPRIGGVLIMGHRGTGKSTAARGLADLLPPIVKVKGCVYGCDPDDPVNLCRDCIARRERGGRLPRERGPAPFVDLPLGATEDRVCGTLNIERALAEGVKAFEPGLLARAHRGFLYIDEVNLLEDHLVDVLLDAAASGRNVVEREGVSVSHPAQFVLVGSGNPEEGDLRPQLLDRFGLYTQIATLTDVARRVEIVLRREQYERDPAAFRAEVEAEQEELRRRIVGARQRYAQIAISRPLLERIAQLCVTLGVDGHRGELTITRAARALAAFEGRAEVSEEDARRVAAMALRHRLRKDPLEGVDSGARVRQSLDEVFSKPADAPPATTTGDEAMIPAEDATPPPGALATDKQKSGRIGAGKRAQAVNSARGRYVGSITHTAGGKVAVDATLRAAAPLQALRREAGTNDERSIRVAADDLRDKRLKRRAGVLFIFAVDASGSMALNRMAQAKGALARLLQQAYLGRDKVALISFRGAEARTLLAPTRSVELAKRLADALPAGGATPMAAGLLRALEIARAARAQDQSRAMVVLFTDGRANAGLRGGDAGTIQEELRQLGAQLRREGVGTVVIDTKSRFLAKGEGQTLADLLGGRYLHLPRADAASICDAVTAIAGAKGKRE